MERLDTLQAVALPIEILNCDTDQILPAQYLQKLRNEDFGQFLFRELRFQPDGSENPDFILNRPAYRPSRIVVAESNFGCGSSREHAVWALYDYGIRVAIAPSFGDIFFSNCLKNGLLPVILPDEIVAAELARLSASPGATIAVDVPAQTVRLSDGSVQAFDVDPFAKQCLVNGVDELGFTLAQMATIDAFEARHGAKL